MNKKIVVINGTGGSGKDTFVSFCSEILKVTNVSAVDKVKQAAEILVGWNGQKDEPSRKLLSDLKRISIEYNDAPTKYIMSRADDFMHSDDDIMFIHIREPEEIEKIKKQLSVKTLLISNPNVKLITSNDSDGKVTEFQYDYYIDNAGTLEDLRKKAEDFLKAI